MVLLKIQLVKEERWRQLLEGTLVTLSNSTRLLLLWRGGGGKGKHSLHEKLY